MAPHQKLSSKFLHGLCLNQCVGQVPNDDPLLGDGTSAPDGEIDLGEDAEETEEQSEKRKEAEESFKVGCIAY